MNEDLVETTIIRLDKGEKIPVNLDIYDGMICLGGPMDTWMEEQYPWMIEEKSKIKEFVLNNQKPYLGICLGCQFLGEILGGKVIKSNPPEIGVLKVSVKDDKSLFRGLKKDLKVLQWHSYEAYDLPANTNLLASSLECKVQAFSFDKAFGLQFHVEQTNKTVPEWACVPEYKSALEKTLGENALEKFKNDVEKNLSVFNSSAKIIYENFKKII